MRRSKPRAYFLFDLVANFTELGDFLVSGSFNKNDLTEIESDLFNPSDLTSLDNVKSTTFYGLVIRPTTELMPIRREISSLKLFYIKVDNARKQTKSSRLLLSQLKENATGLMKDLEKEYNVK